ncbi:MAG: SDR family oxidoreductase [Nitratireductor sp.]|jgi:3-oxoacyl-[acyl-carrier protein] reductase|nr:SDR family oxidoreductase [Nitratireductor sp.]
MNRTILITGAAGGIGRALALFFAQRGWQVAAVDVSDFPRDMQDRPGMSLYKADVTNETAMEALASSVNAEGSLRAAIANAAVTDLDHKPVIDMAYSTWARVMRVNADGAFITARAAARAMGERGGNIVFVTSSLAFLSEARANDAPYSSSKAAVEMLSRVLSLELAPRGINVNTLYPSTMIDTGFFAHWSEIERSRLDPPTLLNEPALMLASLPPGTITGRSLDQARWDRDPAYRAEWEVQ